MASQKDTLDKAVAFFQKRDGVDKALKICRYTSKLLLKTDVVAPTSQLAQRLAEFEGSVGISRKAFRLGKFLQDLDALRKGPKLSTRDGLLHLIANGFEGAYYFTEQGIWLAKAGLIDKRHCAPLTKISAWTEFIGYFGSVSLSLLAISSTYRRETELLNELRAQGKTTVGDGSEDDVRLKELAQLRAKRVLKMIAVVQDAADALLALDDMMELKSVLKNPALLALAGLLSALIGAYKCWPT
eukprot:TRINITY_DN18341_c0_g1_i1.p1 TRINITY_DN18341_c0_g1~~TRINITY_DN18341_c0_g1_i1.p1  ORF type:complete len:242 (+),score=35.22 TRINITY_DN18341_c0_g1_i1:402-1127(+)